MICRIEDRSSEANSKRGLRSSFWRDFGRLPLFYLTFLDLYTFVRKKVCREKDKMVKGYFFSGEVFCWKKIFSSKQRYKIKSSRWVGQENLPIQNIEASTFLFRSACFSSFAPLVCRLDAFGRGGEK
ncbi:MAG: hypothetical protein V3573_06815 [Desulfovibrionaceae bacterium]